jgi:hypothetical protein
MNESGHELGSALDVALSRALRPPTVSADFRARLKSTIAAASAVDVATLRRALQAEQEKRLAALRSDFVHIRRGMLALGLGAAFVAGAAAMAAAPWLEKTLGANGRLLIPGAFAVAGLWVGWLAVSKREALF